MRYKNNNILAFKYLVNKRLSIASTKDFYLIQMAIYRSLDVQSLFAVNGFSINNICTVKSSLVDRQAAL